MAYIVEKERVISKRGEQGILVSFDGNHISVQFPDRTASFQSDAFEKGFLRYENPALQEVLDEEKRQKEEQAARILAAREKSSAERRKVQEELSGAHRRITVLSATFRLDPAPITVTGIRKKDLARIREIFAQCDLETQTLFDSWKPEMVYLDRTTHGRSKNCIGYLSRHLDTYVFRLFSRNDQYKKNAGKYITVTNSNTSEVLRVLRVNGKLYYFSKNLTGAGAHLVNTKGNGNWHVSDLNNTIMVNRVVRNCDCAYLNDYIAATNIDCLQYLNLLFAGLRSNKAEIVLKHRLFAAAHRIDDLEAYLEPFTHKQITVACTHNALNALPVIARHGTLEPEVLIRLEALMRKRSDNRCVYSLLADQVSPFGCREPELLKKLIAFLQKLPHFYVGVYEDYITMLGEEPGVTLSDFFDKNYETRHDTMLLERTVRFSAAERDAYARIAEELSWITREENDLFILLPQTVDDFKYEGAAQHNCVFTNRYFRKVIRKESIVVFLRKEKNTPYVTIEYDYETFEVWQAYGKYNTPVSPELYEYIVNLGKRLNYEMRSHQ